MGPLLSSSFAQSLLHANPVLIQLGLIPLALIVLDALSGIASAVVRHTFAWTRVLDFLDVHVMRYLTACALIAACYGLWGASVVSLVGSLVGVVPLSGVLIASIVSNLSECFGWTPAQASVVGKALDVVEQAIPPIPVGSSSAAGELPPVVEQVLAGLEGDTSPLPSVQAARVAMNQVTAPIPIATPLPGAG